METVNWVTLVLVIVVIAISFDCVVVSNQNNLAIKSDLDSLVQNQQKLLATNYLATSSNNLLIENQKQFVPAIPTIHHTLANVEKILNDTKPIIVKLGHIEDLQSQSQSQGKH